MRHKIKRKIKDTLNMLGATYKKSLKLDSTYKTETQYKHYGFYDHDTRKYYCGDATVFYKDVLYKVYNVFILIESDTLESCEKILLQIVGNPKSLLADKRKIKRYNFKDKRLFSKRRPYILLDLDITILSPILWNYEL